MELSEYNGWKNKFTWLMHLHLSNEQALMDEVMALVASQSRDRAAGRLLKTWVTVSLFNWLCARPERESRFDMYMRLLAWNCTGAALAYADWVELVRLLTGKARKSKNLFTMALYHCILSDGQLLAFVQDMLHAFPNLYQCADTMQDWFREQVDTLFDKSDLFPLPMGLAALVNELLQQTYTVIVWEHVARAFRPSY